MDKKSQVLGNFQMGHVALFAGFSGGKGKVWWLRFCLSPHCQFKPFKPAFIVKVKQELDEKKKERELAHSEKKLHQHEEKKLHQDEKTSHLQEKFLQHEHDKHMHEEKHHEEEKEKI